MSVSQSVTHPPSSYQNSQSPEPDLVHSSPACSSASLLTSQSSFGSQKITPPHSPRGRPRIKMQHIMNCAALSVTLVSSQWSVLGWCLSICSALNRQLNRISSWKGRETGRTVIDNECVLWLCCNCQLIANWWSPGGGSRE